MRGTDRTGEVYGKLTLTHRSGSTDSGAAIWACRCECGSEVLVIASRLISGQARASCGCSGQESHRHSGTPEYNAWKAMRRRCTNPRRRQFKDWGGRGIAVCDRWAHSFSAFLADMGPRPEGMSLDRIDNDGNYEPGNCRWATRLQQNQNRRNTKVRI